MSICMSDVSQPYSGRSTLICCCLACAGEPELMPTIGAPASIRAARTDSPCTSSAVASSIGIASDSGARPLAVAHRAHEPVGEVV